MLWVFKEFAPSLTIAGRVTFPFLVYATPIALFPLMALFMFLKPREYQPYLVLYLAGKVTAVAAGAGWLFYTYKEVQPALGSDPGYRSLYVAGVILLLVAMDVLSVLGGLIINRGQKREAGTDSGPGIGKTGDGGL
jgi:hypothetical protein